MAGEYLGNRFFRPTIAVWVLWTACGGGAGHDDPTGSAGSSAAAGTTGTGGVTTSGGTASSGGTTSTGGTANSAGKTSTGGTTGTGGTTSAGGTTDSAGMTGSAGTLGGALGSAGSSEEAGSGGSTDAAGSPGAAGSAGSAGAAGSGGSAGASGSTGTAGCLDAGAGGSAGTPGGATEKFSFFVTSHDAMRMLSGNEKGFGGDLTFGETGPGAGLRGADKICSTIAEKSMPGAGAKGWRAFLSATTDGRCGGTRVDAIDRVGNGPWYDRLGRLVAANREALLNTRPTGADAAISDDLPDENGAPNHCATGSCIDNHDTLTGFVEPERMLRLTDTCQDWTSSVAEAGRPMVGHSWASQAIPSWLTAHTNQGCAAGGTLVEEIPSGPTVGSGGGYGGIYCFALVP